MLLSLSRRAYHPILRARRYGSTWADRVTKPDNLVQCYVSTSNDPFLNLSIEHYLLEKSPADSVVLFLYINRPCVVIGRNQNPWHEVNLEALWHPANPLGKVDLVRRRSGGGTVFHDEGNVNWTVISPSLTFDRNKHAEMVVRALRRHGVNRARVNERHDIVLDQGREQRQYERDSDVNEWHQTAFTSKDPANRPLKVSGSAYKLIRGKALHHGTCLLTSPNLGRLSHLLRSPARAHMTAKGVASVSSPVSNIGLDTETFKQAVMAEFQTTYEARGLVMQEVGDDALSVGPISKGNDELHTPEWLWDQTPAFHLSTQLGADANELELLSAASPPSWLSLSMEFRTGQVTDSAMSAVDNNVAEAQRFQQQVHHRRLRHSWTWGEVVANSRFEMSDSKQQQLTRWLQTMIPRREK